MFLAGLQKVQLKSVKTKETSLEERLVHDDQSLSALSEINAVSESVFLTSRYGARDLKRLAELKITHILCAAKENNQAFGEHHTVRRFELIDRPEFPIEEHLDEAVDWIEAAVENGGRVLLFCSAGQSRSASLALAFLMRNQSLAFDEAFTALRAKRPVIDPNPGFVEQLRRWELKTLAAAADAPPQGWRGDAQDADEAKCGEGSGDEQKQA